MFKDPEVVQYGVNVTLIGNDGKDERGQGLSVLRDVLTMFSQQVYNSLTIGAQEKVPAMRHDYQKPEWAAIARILIYGYAKVKHFPLSLSRAFIASCLYGEESITHEILLSLFRLCVSEDEREALEKCFGEDFEPNDEEVLDFLSNYKCYRSPIKENVVQTLSELAHKELVQKPTYVMHCWAPIIKALISSQIFTL